MRFSVPDRVRRVVAVYRRRPSGRLAVEDVRREAVGVVVRRLLPQLRLDGVGVGALGGLDVDRRITSYNVCYTKLLRARLPYR